MTEFVEILFFVNCLSKATILTCFIRRILRNSFKMWMFKNNIYFFAACVYFHYQSSKILIGLVVPATRVVIWKRFSEKFAKSQKNICAGVFSIKLQASTSNFIQASASNFIKKETQAAVFSCEFCKIFKNTFFIKHLQMTAFCFVHCLHQGFHVRWVENNFTRNVFQQEKNGINQIIFWN